MSDAGVYVIRNLISRKVYVGSSVKVKRRLNEHRARLVGRRHGNEYLQRAWLKDGPEAFEFQIIEYCTVEDRLVREQYWIDALKAEDERFGYNMIPTREHQLYGVAISKVQRAGWARMSKEERQKVCAHLSDPELKRKAQAAANLARATPEHSELRREIAKRTVCTPATRAKNSARLKALWQDPEWRAKRLAGLDRGREKTNAARKASAMR